MRDLKLFYAESVGFDIDVDAQGYAVEMPSESESLDQRASLGAVFEKGTLPANPEFGVAWDALYNKEASLVDIANDVQTCIQQVSGGDGQATNSYYGMFIPDEKGHISVTVMKGSAR